MIDIDVTTEEDAFTLEEILSRVAKLSTRREINVRLSRNLRADFLREARLASVLATIARDHDLTVSDWYHRWEVDDIDHYFAASVVGMAAVFHSQRITNIAGENIPRERDAFLSRAAAMGGLLERRGRGKSLTFCAFDPHWNEPAALAGTRNRKELFKRTFEKYRQDYLEIGKGLEHTALTR